MKKNIILLFIMASMLLSGCGSENPASDVNNDSITSAEEETTAETEAEEEYSVLSETRDYNGYTFRMLTRPEVYAAEVFSKEITGDIINDAVFNRNAEIESKFNIKYQITESSSHWETDGLKSIMAGEDEYDLIFTHARCAFTYAQNKAVVDWRTLPYVELTEDHWSRDCYENLSYNNKTFGMTGDISYSDFAATECMMFNKQMFDDYHIEYPYEDVIKGAWVYDKFAEIARKLSVDTDADGEMTIGKDIFGYATSDWTGPYAALYCTGERMITVKNDIPEITIYNEKTVDIFEKYLALVNESCTWKQMTEKPAYSYQQAFCNGLAAIIDGKLDCLSEGQFREMETEFGIIPWPKYSENTDKYYAFVNAGSTLCVVPVTNSDLDRTGLVLETMAVLGEEIITPAYYEMSLQNKFLRDEYSVTMLDYIRDGRTVDIGYYNKTLSGDLANLPKNIFDSDDISFTVRFEQINDSVQTLINDFVSKYE